MPHFVGGWICVCQTQEDARRWISNGWGAVDKPPEGMRSMGLLAERNEVRQGCNDPARKYQARAITTGAWLVGGRWATGMRSLQRKAGGIGSAPNPNQRADLRRETCEAVGPTKVSGDGRYDWRNRSPPTGAAILATSTHVARRWMRRVPRECRRVIDACPK